MPEKRMSEAVRVLIDELTTSLLQHVPEETLARVIVTTHVRAERRLKRNGVGKRPRDAVYNARYLCQQMALRLTNPPDALIAALGIKDGKQIDLPDMGGGIKEPLPTTPEEDEFSKSLKIPTFEEYAKVFNSWPYVADMTIDKEHVLVLGYASFRDKETDELVYRNCAYYAPDEDFGGKGTVFRDLASQAGVLKRNKGNVRQFIKVLPFKPGARLRCWTNVRGENRDRPHLTRYVALGTDRLYALGSKTALDEWPRDGKAVSSV